MRTLREVPQREDIYREVMMLYNTMGFRDEALRQYRFLEERLKDTLRVPPSEETRELYDKIKSS
jgi:DNA-binding SARP family transcriptional activator